MKDEGMLQPVSPMKQIIESADRLGIELDEAEAMQWLTAMAATEAQGALSWTSAPASSAPRW